MTETTSPRSVRPAETPAPPPRPAREGRGTRHFLRHFAEMALAMLVGMLLLGPVWEVLAGGLGLAGALERPDIAALVMATNMTLGMSVWMRHRGHGWAPVAEMGAAMYLPFLLFLPPYWLGAVSGDVLSGAGHLLMLPAMLLAMLHRRSEYARPHCAAAVGDAGPTGGTSQRIVAILKHRWPTWLALVVTIDNWTDPAVLDAWSMLILPLAYLMIGAVRRQFGDRRILALQLGGLVGYLVLVSAAMTASDELARYLIGAGWLAHAGWDFLHHRANRVVPRAFSEWCGVVDVVIGISIIVLV